MKSHIIQNGVAEETEVDGMLRNSLLAGDWGMYEELASEYMYLQSTSSRVHYHYLKISSS